MGWEFLAQSLPRLCNEPEQRAGLGEKGPGKMLTWISSQNWFRMICRVSPVSTREGVVCGGERWERLREGRAPASGGDTNACQATITTVFVTLYNAICQDQIMKSTFLNKILPNYSLKNAQLQPFQLTQYVKPSFISYRQLMQVQYKSYVYHCNICNVTFNI